MAEVSRRLQQLELHPQTQLPIVGRKGRFEMTTGDDQRETAAQLLNAAFHRAVNATRGSTSNPEARQESRLHIFAVALCAP
jgi:hypothetical protein